MSFTPSEEPLSGFQEFMIETEVLQLILQIGDDRWLPFIQQNQQLIGQVTEFSYVQGYRLSLESSEEAVDDEDLEIPVVGVSIRFSNDTEIQELNREFRGKDKPTNVLSFPMIFDSEEEMEALLMGSEEGDEILPPLGDIILSFDTCHKESLEVERSFAHHLSHLIVHGILHLLGYDHEQSTEDADIMESLEIAILKHFNVPNPYLLQDE
jgi:probable rRNA maturation factor